MLLYICNHYQHYINFFNSIKQKHQKMISIYQNNFFSYTNLITYIVLPSLQQNQIIIGNDVEYQSLPNLQAKNSDNTINKDNIHNKDGITAEDTLYHHIIEKENHQNRGYEISSREAKKKNSKKPKKEHVQKYGRNICSNIFHNIIKKVLYEKQYNEVILRIISKYQMSITIQQFYSKLYFKQNKLKQYVPFDKIIEFYSGTKNKIRDSMKRHSQFCKILRIISHLYLQNKHIAMAFDCQKLKKESKYYHVKESRKLYSTIKGTYLQEYKS